MLVRAALQPSPVDAAEAQPKQLWLRRTWLGVALAGVLPWVAAQSTASYPSRDVQIIVPNEPGGGLDLVARMLAKGLAGPLGRSVIVVNRSGASGNVGTASVARAEPDGHTLLLTGVGLLVSPMLHSQPGYEPLKDFVPIARIAEAPNVLVVHESVKSLGLSGLLDRSGRLAYGSAGYGQSSHLAAEAVMAHTGARWLHVPYRGTAPASKALLAGDVQLMFIPAGSVQSVLATGMAHAIAVAHPRRLEALAGTPTLAELGVPGVDFSQWYGLLAPAGTPEAVLSRLDEAVARVVNESELRRQLHLLAFEPALLNRAEFGVFLGAQSKRLGALVRQQGVERSAD